MEYYIIVIQIVLIITTSMTVKNIIAQLPMNALQILVI